ncbi:MULTISPECIES: ThiF family adenylyltransferase [unclassified Mesorhizobium]|uniref:HesA/MoeB/ThiF family protein n=1 Tax=unclassified Mesorhizobium TaxID=325217 RepID=UPI0033367B11
MISLAFASPALSDLRDALDDSKLESAAILLCEPVSEAGRIRLLVKEIHIASAHDYLERSAMRVRLDPNFCLSIEKSAKLNRLSLVYVHTHPSPGHPDFSPEDDATEAKLSDYLSWRCPGVPHLALLFPRDAATRCRVMGSSQAVPVVQVGGDIVCATEGAQKLEMDRFDRQIRAFGEDGQKRIAALEVGIVGLGGTGSIVAQQLAHLGVMRFVLIDPDQVETSNLNRVVGAGPTDVLQSKVAVTERMIRSIRSEADIVAISGDVTARSVARRLSVTDFIFSCTDTHSSRHTINQLAYQYLIPTIDLGVAIGNSGDQATIGSHVQMLAPGLPCLWCSNHLNAHRIREELMTQEQRASDPYFEGGNGVRQPAVISLNGTTASLAITMFLSAVAGIPSRPRYLAYDAVRGRMNALAVAANPGCPFCGPESTLGMGDRAPLPGRPE